MKKIAAIFGSLVLLSMSGCNDSNDDTTAQPAPPPDNSASRATARADDVINAMSLDQKIQQIAILPLPTPTCRAVKFRVSAGISRASRS